MSEHTTWTDQHGADLTLEHHRAESGRLGVATDGQVVLSREQVLELYHFLGDHLMATNNTAEAVTTPLPDATADGYDWPAGLVDDLRAMGWTGHPDSPRAARLRQYADNIEAQQGKGDGPTSVATEAHHAVYGDRQADYGHPREDFTRAAVLWTALLQHKLGDGAYIEPEDIGRCMIGVKLARDVHSPKRDNRVDIAGYAITLDRLETGQ